MVEKTVREDLGGKDLGKKPVGEIPEKKTQGLKDGGEKTDRDSIGTVCSSQKLHVCDPTISQ